MLSGDQRGMELVRNIRNSQTIDAEIALLSKLSNQVPRETAFGDSNLDAVLVQIEVLNGRLSLEEIDSRYQNDETQQYVWLCARFACEWLHEEGVAPSEDWMTMLYSEQKQRWIQ